MGWRRILAAAFGPCLALAGLGCDGGVTPPLTGPPSGEVVDFNRPIALLSEDASGRLLRDPVGETRVPLAPRRILALDYASTDALIVLGALPIAAPLYGSLAEDGFFDYERPHLQGVVGLPHGAGPETLLALRPDLILANRWGTSSLEMLRQIAPTVILGSEDPRQFLLDIGVVIGRTPQARAALEAYDRKVERARALLAPHLAGRTVALLRMHQKQLRLYGRHMQGAAVFYEDLGLRPCPYVQRTVIEPGFGRVWLSEEELGALDADQIFFSVDPAARDRTIELLRRNPVWGSLEAVRSGRVQLISSAYITATILARQRIIDDVLVAFGQEPISAP